MTDDIEIKEHIENEENLFCEKYASINQSARGNLLMGNVQNISKISS